MNSSQLSKLLTRLHDGGKAQAEEEGAALHKLAVMFDRQMPRHACPHCWLQRLLAEAKEAFDGPQVTA
jgi:hypothetical protein